jgi:hypothetical protein
MAGWDAVERFGREGGDCILDWECFWTAVQWPFYALYYGSYQASPYLPRPIQDHLLPLQLLGLGVDTVLDGVKHGEWSKESLCDEGHVGPIYPIKDGKGDGEGGVPETYLPGIHEGCRSVDLALPGIGKQEVPLPVP